MDEDSLNELGIEEVAIGRTGHWTKCVRPKWLLDEVGLDKMIMDEMVMDEMAMGEIEIARMLYNMTRLVDLRFSSKECRH